MENKNIKILIAVIAVLVAAAAFAAYFLFIKEKPNENLKNVTVIINTGNGEQTINAETEEGYVYGLLEELKESGKITFTVEEYPTLGYRITSLNGYTLTGNEYFWYYIKSKTDADFIDASAGISSQVINDGDIIKFVVIG